MNRSTPGFLQLIAHGRSDGHPVAHDHGRLVTWKELREQISQLRSPSQGERRRVLLAHPSPLDFLAHFLAVLADGDVPVIPPNFQPQTLATFSFLSPPEGLPPAVVELYTSGSSGEPKCIRKNLAQLEEECRVLESCWGEAVAGTTVAATTPHHHIYGLLFRLLWPLAAGRPFDTATISEPSTFSERLRSLGKTVLVSSPAQLSRLPELAKLGDMAHRPQLIFSSGGPLAADTAHRFAEAWGAPPVEIFGSTETGGIAWRRQEDGSSPWTPLPGVRVAADAGGALVVRSPFLPDDAPLRMEDAVELAEDGRFHLRGRLDRIVKIEEKRLSLPEMEAWLGQHPAVKGAAVVPLSTGTRTIVGAVVVPGAGVPDSRKDLVAALKSHLRLKYDDVLLPRRWRFVECLPYSERGKLAVGDLVSLLNTPL